MPTPNQYAPDPLAVVPPPAEVAAHIGRLLRELRLARRLLRVSQVVHQQRQSAEGKAVGDGR
jgi:hypothetical protein